MKCLMILLLIPSLFFSAEKEVNIEKLSEALGHIMGKNINSTDINFNLDHFIKGVKEANEGKAAPLTDQEYAQAINTLHENQAQKIAQQNLQKAEAFLENNKNCQEIIPRKLHYLTLKKGNGPHLHAYHTPLMRFTGRFLDGATFCLHQKQVLPLQEAIEGFKKGVENMQEGEIRRIYIHPELGFKQRDNSLIIFDVELLKISPSASMQDQIVQKQKTVR